MNIYVGNLNWGITSDDLHDLFSPYGEVSSAKVVTDKFNNNRSKGFGFVEMSDDDAARSAISALNDMDVEGRKIVVNESNPKQGGGSGGGDRRDSGYGGGAGSGGGFKKRNSSGSAGGYGGGGGRDRGNSGGGYGRY